MHSDEKADLRRAALSFWPELTGGRRGEVLDLQERLRLRGYDGTVESLPAESILEGWTRAGWVEVSPDGFEIRLTRAGDEQMARWQEEDRAWSSGVAATQESPKGAQPMKRNYYVMRLVLRQVVDGSAPRELQNYSEELVTYNSALLVKGEYVDGEAVMDGTGHYASVVMLQLTNKGHDLLERLESEAEAPSTMSKSKGTTGQYSVTVFISHSAKDEVIAKALVELLRAALNIPADKIRCTSVNGYRLPAGASVNDQLRLEVHESAAFIALITPSSMESPYVLFELGARWGAGLHLVPLLGAGADSSYMRGPLSTLNALNCEDSGQVHQLVDDLATLLLITTKTAPAAFQMHSDQLVQASKSVRTPAKPAAPSAVLEQRQLQLLNEIREGKLKNLSVYTTVSGDVGKYSELRDGFDQGRDVGEPATQIFRDLDHLRDLHQEGYISTTPAQPRLDHLGRPTDFLNTRITASGRAILDSVTS
jgi:hypothetical protein